MSHSLNRNGIPVSCATSTVFLSLALILSAVPAEAQSPSTAAIDAQVWAPVSLSVRNDDIAAMGAVYHPDAILVTNGATRRISEALAGWGRDMVANKAEGTTATVEFRFSKRQDNAETAFEIGMFKYTTTDKAGKSAPLYIHMEALLVKSGGKWLLIMERQLAAADEAAWNALPR